MNEDDIETEVMLRTCDAETYRGIINELRAMKGRPPITDTEFAVEWAAMQGRRYERSAMLS